MANASVNAELVIRVRDNTSAGASAVERRAEQTAQKTATATERAAQRVAAAEEKAAQRSRSLAERQATAREQIGVRAERTIQREIQLTEAAYNRLARAGFRSAEDQARAYDKTRQKVTQLTNEMGRLTDAQKRAAAEAAALERGQRMLRGGAAAVAGVAAAAYTLKAPTMAAMSFDERLANMANTAYAERDTAGRRLGMRDLEAAVVRAVGKGGGGTRDQAAETLDALIASGAMPADAAMRALPMIMRFSSASGANPAELANIGIRSMQTFGISPDKLPNVLNMAIAAGQEGGFELRDMAKWLPQQMAAATMSGLHGREGFARLAALNQAAAITAGSKDEAGNNVVNLLAKINSRDTATDAQKLGINLPKYLQDRRERGVDSVQAFGELIDRTVSGRADYKALQARLAGAKDDAERRDTLSSMATIAQGAGIGKLVQDRQAMMALLGMMNNREYMAKVLATVRENDVSTGGAGDKNYALIASTASFQVRQAEQAKAAGEKAALDGLTPAIGKAAEAFGDLAQQYPLLTGAATLATGALGALAGAAGLTALAMGGKLPGGAALSRYLGGLGAGAAVPGALTTVAGGGAAAPTVAGATAASRWAMAGTIGAAAAPLGAMYSVTNWAGDTSHDEQRVQTLAASSDVLARVLSMFGLDKSADIEARRAANRAELGGEPPKPAEVDARLTVSLAPGLVLTGQAVQSSGGRFTVNTGNINGVPG